MKQGIILLSLLLLGPPAWAQVPGKLKMSYSAPVNITAEKGGMGMVQCKVEDGVMAKGEAGAKLVMYANNNLRSIPMILMLNDKALKVKPGFNNILFGVPFNEIFFTTKSDQGYSWKWHGRGRAPISPIAAVAKQKVSSVSVWAVLHRGAETYISDTVTIQVQ